MITEEALERQASIRIAIIDDDENSREQIKTITEKTLSEQNQNCFVKTYASAIDLLMDLENGVYYGAFLVDVDYQVYREDQYQTNGVNHRLALLGMEDGEWRIVEWSVAPPALTVP